MAADRTFVGFGFGAIEAGLFLFEAARSGNFARLVVAEVVPEVVRALRESGGRYSVNIAYSNRIEAAEIGPVEMANPAAGPDRAVLVEAVAEAAEIATALPSVKYYKSGAPGSIHRILAEGLRKKAASGGPRAVVYAAENHNLAAELLESAVLEAVPEDERAAVRSRVRFLNTVIGKMSGIIADPLEMESRRLAPVTPASRRAFLVESFNRILISQIRFDGGGFERGIRVFEEKPDLLPFEEAKLYGHNSTHALAAYLGAFRGAQRIADLPEYPGVSAFLEAAFIQESGETLIRRHGGSDPLFTREGYRDFALDLLARMFNAHLGDSVSRVGRDPARKLEWDDRLIGTVRLGLRHGVDMRRYAMGAAAALAGLNPEAFDSDAPAAFVLDPLWSRSSPDPAENQLVLSAFAEARQNLKRWRALGFPDLERLAQQAGASRGSELAGAQWQ